MPNPTSRPEPTGRWSSTAARESLITAVTIPGAVFVIFWFLSAVDPPAVMGDLSPFISIPLGTPIIIGPFLIGGALWGYGTARLVGVPGRPAAKTGALSVTGMVVLLEMPVHMSQALPLPSWFPFGVHGAFTLVFMVEIGLVAGVATTRLAKRIGYHGDRRWLGRRVGLSGAAGFLIGSIVAASIGFEVGAPPSMNMVWALHVANVFAAAGAGWTLGAHLVHHRRGVPPTGGFRASEARGSAQRHLVDPAVPNRPGPHLDTTP